jgi:hypothetical protein
MQAQNKRQGNKKQKPKGPKGRWVEKTTTVQKVVHPSNSVPAVQNHRTAVLDQKMMAIRQRLLPTSAPGSSYQEARAIFSAMVLPENHEPVRFASAFTGEPTAVTYTKSDQEVIWTVPSPDTSVYYPTGTQMTFVFRNILRAKVVYDPNANFFIFTYSCQFANPLGGALTNGVNVLSACTKYFPLA